MVCGTCWDNGYYGRPTRFRLVRVWRALAGRCDGCGRRGNRTPPSGWRVALAVYRLLTGA